jgi:hypothetical protein
LTNWKKAISTLATAALLASLLGTALVGTASAAVGTWTGTGNTYLATCNPTSCTQVADNNTQMQLFAPAGTTLKAGYMTVTGASFASAAGKYVWNSTAGTLSITAGTSAVTDWVSIKSATAGTAVISIWDQADIFTPGVLTGTVSVTFYAAGTSNISAANSFAKTVTYTGVPAVDCATTGYVFSVGGVSTGDSATGTPRAALCVFVGSTTAGTGVGGLSVSAAISPVGLLQGTAVGQSVTLTAAPVTATTPVGTYYGYIWGSGVAGAATITLSTSSLAGGTVQLGTQTFTFTGGISKITAASRVGAVDKSLTTATEAVSYKAFDAAGTRLTAGGPGDTTITAVASTGAPFSLGALTQTTPTASGRVPVTCRGTEGSGTVTVKYTSTNGQTIITSEAITVYCSGTATTFTAAFNTPTIVPGGSAVLTATAKDAAGQPAAGVNWNAFASAGNLFTNPEIDGDQGDGTWTWSYLAPFNSGVVTAAVIDLVSTVAGGYTNLGTKYASLTVGKPVLPAALGSTAATLGVTTSRGAWSTATQVTKVGEFITWRFAAGVANAGKTIGVFLQTKNSSGVWSDPVRFSARVADSQGNAYFSWKGTKAMWVSVRGGLDDARTSPPVQARWQ